MATLNEKSLGKRLQAARRAKGLTQQVLCQQANLSYSTLAKIERGAIKAPSIFTVQSIATALHVGLDELLGTSAAASQPARAYRRTKSGVSFVYFDLNDTLMRASQQGFTALAERSGVRPDIIEMAFWHYNEAMCRGSMTMADLNQALSKRLGFEVDWAETYLGCAESIPVMRKLLEWAASQYRVGLFTNTMPGLVRGLLQRGLLPDVFAEIIDSSETGQIKPEAQAYQLALERSRVAAEEILLIDDNRSNIMAAEAQGWHVALFDGYRANESADRLRTTLEPA